MVDLSQKIARARIMHNILKSNPDILDCLANDLADIQDLIVSTDFDNERNNSLHVARGQCQQIKKIAEEIFRSEDILENLIQQQKEISEGQENTNDGSTVL